MDGTITRREKHVGHNVDSQLRIAVESAA